MAAEYGVRFDKTEFKSTPQKRESRQAVFAAVWEQAQKHEEKALGILKTERGISPEVARGRVAYLPFGTTNLPLFEDLISAGLTWNDKKPSFMAANCLVFPVTRNGRVVNFVFRSAEVKCEAKSKHRKPRTEGFSPQPALWGLDHCRERKFTKVYLCESPIKALALASNGHPNVVAIAGTSFSSFHVRLLQDAGVTHVILCFDNDLKPQKDGTVKRPGPEAAEKAARLLFVSKIKAEIVTLPLKEPPVGESAKIDLDDYFNPSGHAHSQAEFDTLEPLEYFSLLVSRIPKASPADQEPYVRDLLKLLAEVNNPLLESSWLDQILKQAREFRKEAMKDALKSLRHSMPGMLPVGAEFLPAPYARQIMKDNHVIFVFKGFYVYEAGVYKLRHNLELESHIQSDLGRDLLKSTQVEDAMKALKRMAFHRDEKVNKPGILNLKNGYLDLTQDYDAIDLREHNPEILTTVQLPIEFNENAKCPEFDKFLKDKVPDPKLRDLLQEVVGYLLYASARFQKGLILLGTSGTGKSTFLMIVAELIGKENRSAIPLEKLGDRFQSAGLEGRLVNISSEVGAKVFVADATVKAVISGDEITCERKGVQPYSIRPYCRLIVACNELPLTHDITPAFFRRWIIIPFEQTLAQEKWDNALADRICEHELPGVLNWALHGLGRLLKNNRFTECKASLEALEAWKRDADPVREFLHEHVITDKKSRVLLTDLRSDFNLWCSDTGRKSELKRNTFKKRIIDAGYIVKTDLQKRPMLEGYRSTFVNTIREHVKREAQKKAKAEQEGSQRGETGLQDSQF